LCKSQSQRESNMSVAYVQKDDKMLKWLRVIANANRECTVMHSYEQPFGVFDCIEEPKIGVNRFLSTAARAITRWELGMAIVLVDRLVKRSGESFNPLSAHRLIVTALIISVKLQRDVKAVAEYFSRCTGLMLLDLRLMESTFLRMLDWEVFVSREAAEDAIRAIDRLPTPQMEGANVPLVPRVQSSSVTRHFDTCERKRPSTSSGPFRFRSMVAESREASDSSERGGSDCSPWTNDSDHSF